MAALSPCDSATEFRPVRKDSPAPWWPSAVTAYSAVRSDGPPLCGNWDLQLPWRPREQDSARATICPRREEGERARGEGTHERSGVVGLTQNQCESVRAEEERRGGGEAPKLLESAA
ncbi:unnamed protein product [Pleuronectes platessa]|uniref:Uncharacterized protein n=1 Tax=Pleuronectes platessa TaxID=8262 RepID=A0A9N7VPL1_PLEPL|nr:unnamed protein product [Pleuronectes platessa]